MPMILNDEQNMLKDTAKDFCANNAPIEQLRKLRDADSADGFDRGIWSQMVELGWAGIPFPEEHGGLAFGYKGLGVVTEETGRTLTASPLYATVWLGGTVLNLGGQQRAEVRFAAEGDERRTVAGFGAGRVAPPQSLRRRGDGREGERRLRHFRRQEIRARRTRGRQTHRRGENVECGWRSRRHFVVSGGPPSRGRHRSPHQDGGQPATPPISSSTTSPVDDDALIGEEGKGADVLDPGAWTSPASASAPRWSAAPRNVSSAPCST